MHDCRYRFVGNGISAQSQNCIDLSCAEHLIAFVEDLLDDWGDLFLFEGIALEWIHSYYRGGESNSLIKTSELPFWRYAGLISQAVLDIQDNGWSKQIAWTNLYKIAPAEEGNPSDALCQRQLLACQQILKKELNSHYKTLFLPV